MNASPATIGEHETNGWAVAYQFRLDEPSMLLNKWQRLHWAARDRYETRLSWLVLEAIKTKPQTPLQEVWVHVERGSFGVLPDPDGLVGGLKPLLDILTCPRARKQHGLGLIQDDAPEHLKRLTAHSVKTRKGQGYTKVTIFREAAGIKP